MKKEGKFLLLMVMCIITVSANAQFFSKEEADDGVRFGVEFGLNRSWYSRDLLRKFVKLEPEKGINLGLTVDLPVVKSFYWKTGIFFTQKGYNGHKDCEEDLYFPEQMSINYLEIPILASYRYNFNKSTQLQINAGPYVAYWTAFEEGSNGKIKRKDIDSFKDEKDYYPKSFDVGIQVSEYLRFKKHFLVGLGFEYGLLKPYGNYPPKEESDLYYDSYANDCNYDSHQLNFFVSVGFVL